MKWLDVDRHWCVTECGYYTVCHSIGADDKPVHISWYRQGGMPSSRSSKAPLMLGRYRSKETAQRRCAEHERQAIPQPSAA